MTYLHLLTLTSSLFTTFTRAPMTFSRSATLKLPETSLPIIKWKIKSATFTKEKMKPYVGKYPYWIESKCKYAIASINDFPVILLPFRDYDGVSPIALSIYVHSDALNAYGMKRKIWKEYVKAFGTLPKIPLKFKHRVDCV